MARKKGGRSTTSPGLFGEDTGVIPVGMGEPCAGCGGQVDLRGNGWAILADRSFVHQGEECWRNAVRIEMEKMR